MYQQRHETCAHVGQQSERVPTSSLCDRARSEQDRLHIAVPHLRRRLRGSQGLVRGVWPVGLKVEVMPTRRRHGTSRGSGNRSMRDAVPSDAITKLRVFMNKVRAPGETAEGPTRIAQRRPSARMQSGPGRAATVAAYSSWNRDARRRHLGPSARLRPYATPSETSEVGLNECRESFVGHACVRVTHDHHPLLLRSVLLSIRRGNSECRSPQAATTSTVRSVDRSSSTTHSDYTAPNGRGPPPKRPGSH